MRYSEEYLLSLSQDDLEDTLKSVAIGSGNKYQQIKGKKRIRVFQKANGHCWYCGKKIFPDEFDVDHITPRAKGGNDEINNLVPACALCNSQKSNFSLDRFRQISGITYFYFEK